MIRINLLPHREVARKARRHQFYAMVGAAVAVGALVVFLVYAVIDARISNQNDANSFLKKEIAVLDKQLAEIKRLKEQTQALLARKQIIEDLQRDRGETVFMLTELVKQVPDGVYLKSLKQEGLKVNITGYAQSNARVMLLGGEPMDGPRHIWWNFVSSSKDKIEAAKDDWKRGRFAIVPGDETDFIQLPS